ncbi:MAG: hypothetical protein R3313_00880 [Candidatus Saccharimonadales bacterium]|nr:hypothetical protein [Candidatus Saccharimonadales bacterium]
MNKKISKNENAKLPKSFRVLFASWWFLSWVYAANGGTIIDVPGIGGEPFIAFLLAVASFIYMVITLASMLKLAALKNAGLANDQRQVEKAKAETVKRFSRFFIWGFTISIILLIISDNNAGTPEEKVGRGVLFVFVAFLSLIGIVVMGIWRTVLRSRTKSKQ